MGRMFGWLVLAAGVILAGNSGQAADPTGSVSVAAGYTTGPPPKAKPYGTFNISRNAVQGDEFRVLVDYGTLPLNQWSQWTGPATYEAGVNTQVGVSEYTWGPIEETDVTNKPAGCLVRARLQWRSANNVPWVTLDTGYTPVG